MVNLRLKNIKITCNKNLPIAITYIHIYVLCILFPFISLLNWFRNKLSYLKKKNIFILTYIHTACIIS